MAAYREWAKEEYKQFEASQPIPLIENKEDMSMEAMAEWFDEISERVRAGTIIVELIPIMIYEWMDANGNIPTSPAKKREYLQRAVNYRLGKLREAVEDEDCATNRNLLADFLKMQEAGCFEGAEITHLKVLAKQMLIFELILEKHNETV